MPEHTEEPTDPSPPTSPDPSYKVRPTSAASQANTYSDIALTGLFNSHIVLINSERQAIWQRFAAMVVANSIVLSLLGAQQTPCLRRSAGILFGLLLCAAWWVLTVSGWRFLRDYMTLAKAFTWTEEPRPSNPLHAILTRAEPRDWIFRTTLFIVCLFAASYAFMFLTEIIKPPRTTMWRQLAACFNY